MQTKTQTAISITLDPTAGTGTTLVLPDYAVPTVPADDGCEDTRCDDFGHPIYL